MYGYLYVKGRRKITDLLNKRFVFIFKKGIYKMERKDFYMAGGIETSIL